MAEWNRHGWVGIEGVLGKEAGEAGTGIDTSRAQQACKMICGSNKKGKYWKNNTAR